MWELKERSDARMTKAQILLTGASGIGKSIFQLYLLHRLLNEVE
jgi:GTPase SAR1 family protein